LIKEKKNKKIKEGKRFEETEARGYSRRESVP